MIEYLNLNKTKSNGMAALIVLLLIVLGCTCNRTFDVSNSDTEPMNETTANQTETGTDASLPSDSDIERLIRETARDFADAIDRSDFSDIYEKASPDFQRSYSEDQMKDAFSGFITRKRQVVPILRTAAGMKPKFEGDPYLRKQPEGTVLVVKNKVSTRRAPVEYDLEYVHRDNRWKILKLIVKVGT